MATSVERYRPEVSHGTSTSTGILGGGRSKGLDLQTRGGSDDGDVAVRKPADGCDRLQVDARQGSVSDKDPLGIVPPRSLAVTMGKNPRDVTIGVQTEDTIPSPQTTASVFGGDRDPPKRPTGDQGLKKSHYLDVEETGRLPVLDLSFLKMASPGPSRLSTHMDPASRSKTDPETRDLALRQTAAARELLYNPGAVFQQELGGAAAQLHTIVNNLHPLDQRALGARLLGSEGLLPDEQPAALIATLQRVANDPIEHQATANDRAVVIALMGDIGALYADTGATTGVEGRSDRQAGILRGHFRHEVDRQHLESVTPQVVRDSQRLGGSSVVGPNKKAERTRPPAEKPDRTGIHNLGSETDRSSGVPQDQRLHSSRWDVAHIQRGRVYGTQEPLVGHMSGSPAEILQTWDMLRGVRRDQQFVGVMNTHQQLSTQNPGRLPMQHMTPEQQQQQLARAAGAAAFLVGMGYHSAVECAEGVLAYTGQNLRQNLQSPRQDAGHLLGRGAATDLLVELFQAQTQRPNQL